MNNEWHHLIVVYGAYVIAAGSPGPSNMRIMGVAMHTGRKPALVLAAGVLTGAIFWGFMAATGVSAVLTRYANLLTLLKIFGGLYLLYLAYKAGKNALTSDDTLSPRSATPTAVSYWKLYRHGLLMHLTNPKAILSWIALMALGLGPSATSETVAAILVGCAALGAIIFSTYAVLFSTSYMVRAYQSARRVIESLLSVCFALAGVRLLMTHD